MAQPVAVESASGRAQCAPGPLTYQLPLESLGRTSPEVRKHLRMRDRFRASARTLEFLDAANEWLIPLAPWRD
jgi:hypothetical protein